MLEGVESQIEAAEEQLRLAMLASDVESLDALISPSLIFTTHFGLVISKQDDLEIHRSGVLKFEKIEPSERKVLVLDRVAYVSVRAHLSGVFDGSPFHDDIRFSRVWQLSRNNAWQIVAGQATVVQAP
ncbi:nuclear transport factor 2 family protein [Propionivibrio soli]|uniref:nuclear transport factor 2 family protein n=1 Tax=Propionivibrio soli TaxID=2976531 RepID=UPI0021E95284|nr:nuclear transport factor 2 family protein [Propionivibrio soli]